mmetsp:Transcript_6290/g.13501  ORF Transcript_6290/g.13501 Transcript_6290/m.13501 type:complete len:245 (+) Transcript_6290:1129-1863(+)
MPWCRRNLSERPGWAVRTRASGGNPRPGQWHSTPGLVFVVAENVPVCCYRCCYRCCYCYRYCCRVCYCYCYCLCCRQTSPAPTTTRWQRWRRNSRPPTPIRPGLRGNPRISVRGTSALGRCGCGCRRRRRRCGYRWTWRSQSRFCWQHCRRPLPGRCEPRFRGATATGRNHCHRHCHCHHHCHRHHHDRGASFVVAEERRTNHHPPRCCSRSLATTTTTTTTDRFCSCFVGSVLSTPRPGSESS